MVALDGKLKMRDLMNKKTLAITYHTNTPEHLFVPPKTIINAYR